MKLLLNVPFPTTLHITLTLVPLPSPLCWTPSSRYETGQYCSLWDYFPYFAEKQLEQEEEGETEPAPNPKDPLPPGGGLNIGDVLNMTPKKKSATCGRRRAWSANKKRTTLEPDLPPPTPPPSAECAPKKYLTKGLLLINSLLVSMNYVSRYVFLTTTAVSHSCSCHLTSICWNSQGWTVISHWRHHICPQNQWLWLVRRSDGQEAWMVSGQPCGASDWVIQWHAVCYCAWMIFWGVGNFNSLIKIYFIEYHLVCLWISILIFKYKNWTGGCNMYVTIHVCSIWLQRPW